MKKTLKSRFFYFSLVFLLVGVLIGYFGNNYFSNQNSNNTSPSDNASEFHAGGYSFINPLYECNTGQSFGTKELSNLKSEINNYINQLTANNSVTSVAVYYRDLNNGPWFGISENTDFAPSSLLKVPVMMAYFREAESNPAILEQKIKYSTQIAGVIPQNFEPKSPIVLGKTYTAEELIERMIIGSDNAALGLLENNIDGRKIDQVTLDLGITTATDATPTDFMNVQEYATLFRVLYYSTYLNRDYSEKALELLAQAEFKQGLVDILPNNIQVAHKFGERELGNGIHQLHDCGIIYYSNRPYLLCVMTKGPNFNDLAKTIQQISDKIYKEALKMYH